MTVKTCVPLVFDVGIEVGNMRTCKQRNASGPAEEFQCYPEGELTVHTIYGVENGERCADVGREQTHNCNNYALHTKSTMRYSVPSVRRFYVLMRQRR
jgi:hypothetical protein